MSVQVKICGLRDLSTLEAAIAAGANYIGLVFFAKSPRNIGLEEAKKLARAARGKVKSVALLVNPDDVKLGKVLDIVNPDVIQLHGDESPERVGWIASNSGKRVIKAVKIATRADVAASEMYLAKADIILFDAKPPPTAELPGGNGIAFDWRILESIKGTRFMLSGGLSPDNVAEAIRLTGAAMVDVSSGVESAPGIKSPALIGRFIKAVGT
jgi:phosphoribosylanthranilate isomerase